MAHREWKGGICFGWLFLPVVDNSHTFTFVMPLLHNNGFGNCISLTINYKLTLYASDKVMASKSIPMYRVILRVRYFGSISGIQCE